MKREERNFEDVNYVHYLEEVERGLMFFVLLALVSLAFVLTRALKNFINHNLMTIVYMTIVYTLSIMCFNF